MERGDECVLVDGDRVRHLARAREVILLDDLPDQGVVDAKEPGIESAEIHSHGNKPPVQVDIFLLLFYLTLCKE